MTSAHRRFSPASTFKIFNTLISMEAKAIAGADALPRWDGQPGALAAWNLDQRIASAFQVSCVGSAGTGPGRARGDTWAFATNLDIRDERDMPLRQWLTWAPFLAKGLLER